MGVEDAAILGGLLSAFPSPRTLSQTLPLYEAIRKPRAAKIASASIDSKYFTQMPDGAKQRERDEYLLGHPGIESGHWNIRSQSEFLDELFGYDAFGVVEENVEILKEKMQKRSEEGGKGMQGEKGGFVSVAA